MTPRSARNEHSTARLVRVGKNRGRRTVLQDVDLDVRPGEIVGVLGANGSGKTTLLRVLVGLSRPSSGTVVKATGAVAYVPEVFASHDRMSAAGYLHHLGRVRGLSTGAADRRGGALLEQLGLAGGADSPLRHLSKGNAQKVALAQSLLVTPALLVLDEPWSGLDAGTHPQLANLLQDVTRAGGSVVVTDHDLAAVNTVATRICELAGGRLAERPSASTRQGALLRVELVAPVDTVDPLPWNGFQEVQRAWCSGREHTLLVAEGAQDRVLHAALAAHWSVRAVGPAQATPGTPGISDREDAP